MDRERITAWITTYALTGGIKEVEGDVCHGISSDMLSCAKEGHFHDSNWHRTKEAALVKAEEMRLKKIASLKKQIEKLEKLRFE